MELADWLKENPMLYTKSMKEYKDMAKKTDLWNSKAAELDLESESMLKTWYESVRTKVGKLSDKKSGSATKDMTDRDTFLMQNFGFLASHIERVKGRPACSVSINLHYYCDFFLSFLLHDVMIECILLYFLPNTYSMFDLFCLCS